MNNDKLKIEKKNADYPIYLLRSSKVLPFVSVELEIDS